MNKSNSLFDKQLIKESLGASVRKLDPRTMIKNPIMFTVEIVTAVMFVLLFYILISGDTTQGSFGYNLVVFVVLFITLLFANFAEAIAEARGKAQADSLRKTREETPAKLVNGNTVRIVSSNALKKTISSNVRRATSSRPTARSSRGSPRSTKAPLPAKARR